jgi:hypothetical protein
MKVAILSESLADEVALRILVDGILGRQTQPANLPPLRTRGWPAVLRVLPSVLQHLHYQTDAEALVVVTDTNHSPVHQAAHDQPGGRDNRCRLCQLREQMTQIQSHLRPVAGRQPLQTAVGVAAPAIEAWYRCGVDPHASEATWVQHLQAGSYTHIKSGLKQAVYGTDHPSPAQETRRASEAAQRLTQNLSVLADLFPNGFRPLVRDVRSWPVPS